MNMEFYIILSPPRLRVFSAICTNLAAGWIAIILVTSDLKVLLMNVVFAIVSIYYSLKAEELIEMYGS
jgi:hypothetical protein